MRITMKLKFNLSMVQLNLMEFIVYAVQTPNPLSDNYAYIDKFEFLSDNYDIEWR